MGWWAPHLQTLRVCPRTQVSRLDSDCFNFVSRVVSVAVLTSAVGVKKQPQASHQQHGCVAGMLFSGRLKCEFQGLFPCHKILFFPNHWKAQGSSLEVQWVRLHAPNAGGPGLIPGRGTMSHMPQLRSLNATTKRSYVLQRRSRVPQLRPGAAKINK